MADVAAFQRKLGDILTLAKLNGKKVTEEGVALFFGEENLSTEQLEKVFDYLRIQGIQIQGREKKEEVPKEVGNVLEGEAAPLSPEEESYLQDYKKSLKAPGEGTPLENSMWKVIEIAKEMHRGEIFLGDLIQEGNISLMMALKERPDAREEELLRVISDGMKRAMEEQTRQKYQDDFLVEKVRHLEESIRELTDGVGEKSSIEELSAFLDMEEEEIRAVLRLTGDMDE